MRVNAMKQVFQTIWWWTRVGLLVVVAIYALALLAFNSNQRADVWYWPGRPAENTSIIALVLASFIAGGLVCTIGFALFSAWVGYRRTRQLRRARADQERREELQRKAAMLRVKPPPAAIVRGGPVPAMASATVPATLPPAPSAEREPIPLVEPKPSDRMMEPVATPLPIAVPTAASAPTPRDTPIVVDAHRATPFAVQPIAGDAPPVEPPATGSGQPHVIDPPTSTEREG